MKNGVVSAILLASMAAFAAEAPAADAPLPGQQDSLVSSLRERTEAHCDCAQRPAWGSLFLKTSLVGTASTATGALVGAGLGSLSNNLIGAAVPVLLANLFLPPVLTVAAALLMANWDDVGRFGFWAPVAGAFVVNAAAYVLASLVFVVPWANPAALLVYSLVDGLLMSGASMGLMALTENKATPTTVTSFVPGVTDTTVVPVWKVDL